MRKSLRIIRKIFFWLFFVCLSLTTFVTVILYIYEDDIKQYAIEELNSYLNTDVEVQNIELSIFHEFPYASLRFEKVFVPDAFQDQESSDTLLFAETMFFNFSLLDIWNEDYKVKRVSAANGQLNLKTTAEGDFNYGIIREQQDSAQNSSNFDFMLELLKLQNIDFSYRNNSTRQFYDIYVHEGLMKGNFSAQNYKLEAEGELYIDKLKSNSFSLIRNKSAHLDLDMDINRTDKAYTFNKGDLMIEEMPFNVTGKLDSVNIDLSVVGRNVQLDQLANSFVDESLQDAKKYQGKGVVDFKADIKGPISKTAMPSVTADFNLIGGSLTEPESKVKVSEINLIGHYRNEQSNRKEELHFENFSFKLLQSKFSGAGRIKDFAQPILETEMRGQLDLAAFHQFIGFKNIEKIGGGLYVNLDGAIQFFDPEYRKDEFDILKADGHIELKDVFLKRLEDDIEYKKIDGDIIVHGQDAAAKDLYVETEKSDVLINGAIKNFIPYIEGNEGLGLIASVESSVLDLNEFVRKRDETRDESVEMFRLPENVNLNLEMDVDTMSWENHLFEDISGQLLLVSRNATLKNFHAQSLGGSVSGTLNLFNGVEEGNVIDGDIRFANVNVKALFSEWDNFKQESITSDHISGTASGKMEFILPFNPYFSLLEDKLVVQSDIKISNGELTQLDMMKDITAYMRSNKSLKLLLNKHIEAFEDKLLNLKFSDLENQITIRDRKINIPRMSINSNALNLELFGWHDLDNNVDYHFSFRFRDLKTKAEDTEFGKIEDDGLGLVIYLTMTGNLDDPQFALDSEERKNQLRQNIVQEKEDIKSILKTELGLFKKDTTVQRMVKENQREVEFIFYEDDVETTDTTSTKQKNKKRTNKIFDKMKEKSKEDVEYDIEFE